MEQIFSIQVQVQFYLQDVSYKMVETYLTVDGIECVIWSDEQGTHSMTKTAYDEQQDAIKINEPASKS